MDVQIQQLMGQVQDLTIKYGQLTSSSTIPRAVETAFATRLGTGNTTESFPIGAYFFSAVTTNPNTLLGYGTWTQAAEGQVLVGFKSGDTNFGTLGGTGGEAAHSLLVGEIPAHNHSIGTSSFIVDLALRGGESVTSGGFGYVSSTNYTGGGGSHNNIQPYLTCYIWQRTA